MTNPYTPEKVAELIGVARRYNAVNIVRHLADALTAVSAERDAAIRDLAVADRQFTKLKEQTGSADAERIDLRADRDRLHKAITEALAFESVLPAIATEPRRILRAALDKEGNDDE